MRPVTRRWCMRLMTVALLAVVCTTRPAVVVGTTGDVARAADVAASSAEQPQEPPAREEFVPVSELPPEEQIPAAPLLIAGYAVAWLVVIGYVWRLWRRLARVERELHEALRAEGKP
ncbi:MAG: CcmD family protein [Luteitalea sp.]|nr:CcmD family protein [Luteitalea sp.]